MLLTSFLFIILMRVLRNDYARYSALELDPEDGTVLGPDWHRVVRLATLTMAAWRGKDASVAQMRRIMAGS